MGLNKIDFSWNTMVRTKDFNCPHVGGYCKWFRFNDHMHVLQNDNACFVIQK
jgi:hypothetical protein